MGCDIHVLIESSADGVKWELDKRAPFEKYGSTPENPLDGSIFVGRDHHGLFWLLTGHLGNAYFWDRKKPIENGIERAKNQLNGINISLPHEVRGVPDDASPEVKGYWAWQANCPEWGWKEVKRYAMPDYPSWMTLKEILYVLNKHRKNGGPWYRWTRVVQRMKKIEEGGRISRVLYWFDY